MNRRAREEMAAEQSMNVTASEASLSERSWSIWETAMNDLSERLRSGEEGLEYAAADEIDCASMEAGRLRVALIPFSGLDPEWPPPGITHTAWRIVIEAARKALDGGER
jgi:hypothetical protein